MAGKECSDRDCQQELRAVHQEVFGLEGSEGLSHRVKMVEENQERRTPIIDSKMPKAWLWTIIVLVAPVTSIALMILISQATADARFADKVTVTKHEAEICMLKNLVEERLQSDRDQMRVLDEILKAVKE
ncbi:MAG: hypothetical protein WBN66_02275 [Smithella sp.]